MPKDLKLIGDRETIELQHDRGIQRGNVAMPDVAGHPGEKNVGVAALKRSGHRHLWNGMTLPKIFAEKQCINAGRVAAHNDVLIVVWKNLGLDEITWAQQFRDCASLPNTAQCALLEFFIILEVGPLQLFAGQPGNFFAVTESEMAR